MVAFSFLGGMRAVKRLDLAILLEPHPRAAPFDYLCASGNEQTLDCRPFDGAGHRVSEDNGQGLAVFTVHWGI